MPLSTNCVEFWPLITNNLVGSIGGNTLSAVNFAFESGAPGPDWKPSASSAYLLCQTLSLSHPFTVAAQVYVNGGVGSAATFIGFLKDGTNYWQMYQTPTTNKLFARARSGGTAGDADGGGVTGGAFNNCAGVFTSSTKREAYLATTLGTPETTSVSPAGAASNFTIGALYDGTNVLSAVDTTWRFKNVAVWSRALTDAELDSYFSDPTQVLAGSGAGVVPFNPPMRHGSMSGHFQG